MKRFRKWFVLISILFFVNNVYSQKVEVINGTEKKLKEGLEVRIIYFEYF